MKPSSTVTIHGDGTVSYWSPLRGVQTRSAPEAIEPRDLQKMTNVDRNRLVNRFGLVRTPTGQRLRSAAERGHR